MRAAATVLRWSAPTASCEFATGVMSEGGVLDRRASVPSLVAILTSAADHRAADAGGR